MSEKKENENGRAPDEVEDRHDTHDSERKRPVTDGQTIIISVVTEGTDSKGGGGELKTDLVGSLEPDGAAVGRPVGWAVGCPDGATEGVAVEMGGSDGVDPGNSVLPSYPISGATN